jgi:hypothetical protein
MIQERRDQTVYQHRRNDTGEIFYIGRGVPGRANVYGRNPHWENIVTKHGYSVEVVASGLTVEEANAMEIVLIDKIGRRDLKTGPLVNKTAGGEGMVGWVPSDETRAKLAAAKRGKKLSDETRAKLAEANRRYFAENPDNNPMKRPEVAAKQAEAKRRFYAENPTAREKLASANRTPNTDENALVGIHVHNLKSGPRYQAFLEHNGKRHLGPRCSTPEDARLYRLLLEAYCWEREVAA